METKASFENAQKKLLWIAIIYVVLLLSFMGAVTAVLYNQPNIFVAYVPVSILEWSFTGGMVAVLYRLGYQQTTPGIRFYIWVVVKPVIGLVMGGLIYLIALGGGILLGVTLQPNGQLPLSTIYWLNALAFIGGFSDQFSIELINRVVSKSVEQHEDKTGSEQEQSDESK